MMVENDSPLQRLIDLHECDKGASAILAPFPTALPARRAPTDVVLLADASDVLSDERLSREMGLGGVWGRKMSETWK